MSMNNSSIKIKVFFLLNAVFQTCCFGNFKKLLAQGIFVNPFENLCMGTLQHCEKKLDFVSKVCTISKFCSLYTLSNNSLFYVSIVETNILFYLGK